MSELPPEPTVLLVEDEESFVQAISAGLAREGFRVELARDGIEALDRFGAVQPDLVLVDVDLPSLSGLEVCREIRSRSSVPIVVVSAKSTPGIDPVVVLESGADDVVTTPLRVRELVARLRAILRRSPLRSAQEDVLDMAIEVGDLRLDPERHEAMLSGRRLYLPLKEFELLELLMLNAGRVVARDTIIARVWGPDYGGDSRTLDVHVRRLRAKIEDDPSSPTRLTTVRGLGYRLQPGSPASLRV